MKQGYIKLYRQIEDNKIWLEDKFTDGQAWIDLILLANHKDGIIKKRGIRLQIKRGELGWSELSLAKRWQWSRGKVRRYLKYLESLNMIKMIQQKNKVTTHIIVVNYDKYQDSGTTNGHQTDIKRYRNNNDNKDNKEDTPQKREKMSPKKEYSEEFLLFWQAYPKKVGKKDAGRAWKKAKIGNGDMSVILTAIEAQKKTKQWQDLQYVPAPATWINGARWEDKVEEVKKLTDWEQPL
jgi:hypothetical protein